MATLTLTENFSFLDDWPGLLLQVDDNASVIARTSTRFAYRFDDAAGAFAGYRVEVTGTGFRYDAGEPIEGTMSRVRILDARGATVITFSSLGDSHLINDLSQFYASVFGSHDPLDGTGPFPDGALAWSLLTFGNDTIMGTEEADTQGLAGFGMGDDYYAMLGGDDWVAGGMGNDTVDGGEGYDIYALVETSYVMGSVAVRGASVNMQTGIVEDPWGGTDVLIGIEDVRGSRFDDSFIGNDSNRDRFAGLRGRDELDGGANTYTDTGELDEDRRDEVRYDLDIYHGGRRGIRVDLETTFDDYSITGQIRDGFGNLDVVRDIERVVGTRYDDTFIGSHVRNVFSGGQGVDRYDGQGGEDAINFGRVTGEIEPRSGIVVNLGLATGQIRNDGFGNVETALSIEHVWGTALNDRVRGGSNDEELWLADGRDTMTGGGGVDTFVWESLDEFGDGDLVTDFRSTGPSADRLAFNTPLIDGMTTDLVLVNGSSATEVGVGTFIFNPANDTLYWDGDGAGGASKVAIVVLDGVAALTSSNFDLWA